MIDLYRSDISKITNSHKWDKWVHWIVDTSSLSWGGFRSTARKNGCPHSAAYPPNLASPADENKAQSASGNNVLGRSGNRLPILDSGTHMDPPFTNDLAPWWGTEAMRRLIILSLPPWTIEDVVVIIQGVSDLFLYRAGSADEVQVPKIIRCGFQLNKECVIIMIKVNNNDNDNRRKE